LKKSNTSDNTAYLARTFPKVLAQIFVSFFFLKYNKEAKQKLQMMPIRYVKLSGG